MKKGYVLIPGAGMSDWVWGKLKEKLNAEILMVSERIEENSVFNRQNCDFEDVILHARNVICKSNFDEIILVAHSGAGLIAAELGKLDLNIKHVVYLAANIPPNGGTALSLFTEEMQNANIDALTRQAEDDVIPMKKLEKQFREYFCNCCDESDIQFILKQEFHPEPVCVVRHHVNWDQYPSLDMTYILTTRDKTLTEKMQEGFARNLQIKDIRRLDTDHMLMFSATDEVAEILNKILNNI